MFSFYRSVSDAPSKKSLKYLRKNFQIIFKMRALSLSHRINLLPKRLYVWIRPPVLYRPKCHRCTVHRAPTFRGPPKFLDLAIFLSFHSCIFIFFYHFLWKSLNFLHFMQIVSHFHNFSNFLFVRFPKSFFFLKAARKLTLFQEPQNFSLHRAPKKLDTALFSFYSMNSEYHLKSL